ncbi:MAG: bifunctional glycosyltransferase family 2/GtrA family protein [Clostridiales bacterium]|nr:bifunctional glycosyltransferase family 2/GtrA family protein [Clostridiales bacterium]
MEYLVIIPALDPEPCLEKLVDRLWELGNQVLVVDDGSRSEYKECFQRLEKKCIVLHHKENKGKGEAIKTALQYIRSELWEYGAVGVMDADGQHLPEDMEKLLMQAGINSRTLILGTRIFDQSVPWKSRMGNQITRKIFQITTGAKISDTQTGLRAFSSDLLDFMLEIPGERYEYEMNVLINCVKKGIPIMEVPISTIYHDKGNSCSHFRKVRDSIRIYRKLLKFSASSFSSFLLDYLLFLIFTAFLPSTAGGILGANIGARLLSAVYNYTMNCHFVFHEKQSVRTGSEYIALAGFILMLNNLILEFLTMILEIPVYPAKILTEITLFLVSWLVQKKLIFGKRKGPGSSPKEEFKKNLKTYRGIFNEGCYSSKKRNQEA